MTEPHSNVRLKVGSDFDNDGTPETIITSEDGQAAVAVAIDFGPRFPGMREANARRLVACWNACEGLTQDHFDGDWTAKGLSQYAKNLEGQVADLRAALQAQQGDAPEDFAKIVRASNGQQVLFYMEDTEDMPSTMHCVASFNEMNADLKFGGLPEDVFKAALEKADKAMADKVLAQFAELGLAARREG